MYLSNNPGVLSTVQYQIIKKLLVIWRRIYIQIIWQTPWLQQLASSLLRRKFQPWWGPLKEDFSKAWKRIFKRIERGFFKGYLFSEMKHQREKFGYRWSSRLFDGGNKISAKFDKNQFWKGFNLSFWFWLRSVNSHWSSKW